MKISDENVRFSAPERALLDGRAKGRVFTVLSLAIAGALAIFVANQGDSTGSAKAGGPDLAETLPYGSRQGMDVTVVSKEGIGTSKSVIRAEITEANARVFCSQYLRDPSRACIKTQIQSKLSKAISANCTTGKFTNFYEEKFKVVKTKEGGIAGQSVINSKTREALDGSAASGLSYNMAQFTALCPTTLAANPPTATATKEDLPQPAPGRSVTARGAGIVPGAIICPDLATVTMMLRLSAQHWEQTAQDAATQGQSELIRGKALPAPDLAAFGCALIPSGAPMTVESEQPIPIVSAKLSNGAVIRGVTFSYMFGRGNTPGIFSTKR
jgi:hypothetical protein